MRVPDTANRADFLQIPRRIIAKKLRRATGGTAPWSPQRIDYKRKRRDTWTRYEVGKPLGLPGHGRQTC